LIIERFTTEKKLRPLEKCQFVLPSFATIGQLQHVIRRRVCDGRMAIYVLAGNGEIPDLNCTMADLAMRWRDDDGFTYLRYSSEETLG
jgi:GABA(A) receptor-associated protein